MTKPKKDKEPVTAQQLALFQSIVDTNFSNAVELYDAMPKYVYGRRAAMREHDLPPEKHVIERQWNYPIKLDGKKVLQQCYLRLSPATIIRSKGGKVERFYIYPGYREMIVEDAIRKIAVDNGGTLTEGVVGCRFTIRQVRRILSEGGHTMKHDEVAEAINVLNKCHVEYGFIEADGKTRVSGRSALFPETYVRKSDEITTDDMQSAVMFHELVNRSIRNLTFRNLDFTTCIKYKSMLSSYLHKRLNAQFLQASRDTVYRVRLTELAESSGLAENGGIDGPMPLKEQVRCVKEALDELKKYDVVEDYDVIPIPDPNDRRKRIDTVFEIRVTDVFVKKVIRINGHSKHLLEGTD